MAILDTNTINPEIEQAALWPFLNAEAEKLGTVEAAAQRAKEEISPLTLMLIDKCEALEGKTCDDPEAEYERKMCLYDAKAAIRGCAEEVVSVLQYELPEFMYKIGSTPYMMIRDPHAKVGNGRQLIMLDDADNVSFMEPRGLEGDGDLTFAKHEHYVQLIEDVIEASQPVRQT